MSARIEAGAPEREGVEARTDLARTRMHVADRSAAGRTALVVGLLLTALATAGVLSVHLGGSVKIPLGEALPALVDRSTPLANYVVFETRLPRALGALLAGSLFGLSGCLYQRVVGNALATPDIIGITAGATAGAVILIVVRPDAGPGLQMAALLGALLSVGVVYVLTWRGGLDTYRLILIGIAVSAVATAITNYVLIAADLAAITEAVRWTAGSTSGLQWSDVRVLLIVAACGATATLGLTRSLRGLSLGDDLARGLGVRVGATRLATLAVGAAVAALVTSVVGPIAFVSLVAGPIAVRLAPRGPVLLLAGLVGAVEVLAADVMAQNAPYISPVPTGALTAVVGAPVFIWLLLVAKAGGTR